MSTAAYSNGVPTRLRLGLIGDNIRQSRAPALHRLAGRLAGLDVTYDLLIPAELGKDFDQVFEDCRKSGTRGLNITYPYKERVLSRVAVGDPFIRMLGSVNTVLFEPDGPVGYNTDHTGFIAAYREAFGDMSPGITVIVGAGGAGRAVAFGLVKLGASRLRIVDGIAAKSGALETALKAVFGDGLAVETGTDTAAALAGADGVANCTPIGMSGYPGSAVPAAALAGRKWAFDVVYTPVETEFKRDCERAGVRFLSGYELFFHQGVDAFGLFSGGAVADPGRLRQALAELSG